MVGPKLAKYGRGLQNPLWILEAIESVTGKPWHPSPFYQVLVIAMGSPTLPKTSTSGSRRCRPEARMMAGYTNNTDLTAFGNGRCLVGGIFHQTGDGSNTSGDIMET